MRNCCLGCLDKRKKLMKDRSAHSSTLNLLQINLLPGNYYPIAHNCKMVAFFKFTLYPSWVLSSRVSREALWLFGRSAGEDQQGGERPVSVGQHGLLCGCHVCHVSQQRHLRYKFQKPPVSLCDQHLLLPDLRPSLQALIWTQQWLWASVYWARCPGTDWCPTASPSCWGLTWHQGSSTWSTTVTVSSS